MCAHAPRCEATKVAWYQLSKHQKVISTSEHEHSYTQGGRDRGDRMLHLESAQQGAGWIAARSPAQTCEPKSVNGKKRSIPNFLVESQSWPNVLDDAAARPHGIAHDALRNAETNAAMGRWDIL